LDNSRTKNKIMDINFISF